MIGKSKKMQELFELIESVAASEANILIQGENGTGKELIANAIHYNSKRSKGPFIKINCAAIPKDLIESELFGYKKGAFTGATTDKEGLFEMAEGGSLLLDEIGEMPSYLQTKLLRVLQEREYRPIGSDRIVHVDFRLICATNIDLDAALRDGRLREDLYFRINTITLARAAAARAHGRHPAAVRLLPRQVPAALPEEREDARAVGVPPAHPQPLARERARARERDRTCRAGRARGRRSRVADLPESIREEIDRRRPTSSIPPHRTLAEIEKMAILQTLQRTNWNKQEAAQILGLYRPDALQQDEEARHPRRRQGRAHCGGHGSHQCDIKRSDVAADRQVRSRAKPRTFTGRLSRPGLHVAQAEVCVSRDARPVPRRPRRQRCDPSAGPGRVVRHLRRPRARPALHPAIRRR